MLLQRLVQFAFITSILGLLYSRIYFRDGEDSGSDDDGGWWWWWWWWVRVTGEWVSEFWGGRTGGQVTNRYKIAVAEVLKWCQTGHIPPITFNCWVNLVNKMQKSRCWEEKCGQFDATLRGVGATVSGEPDETWPDKVDPTRPGSESIYKLVTNITLASVVYTCPSRLCAPFLTLF